MRRGSPWSSCDARPELPRPSTLQRLLEHRPDLAPWRPTIGFQPRLSDADLVTLTHMQAVLGHTNEARWLRYARPHLAERFPYLPRQSGYNKRLRKAAGPIRTLIRYLATDTSVFWGLRPHLVRTLSGLPAAFAVTGAEADERTTGDLAFLRCHAPESVSLRRSVAVAGRRWRVEESFQQGKGLAGLNEHQVRM